MVYTVVFHTLKRSTPFRRHGLMGNPRQTRVPANHGLQVMLVLVPLTSPSLLRRASLVSPRFSLLRHGVFTTSYSRSDISLEAHDCSSLTRLQGKPFEFQMPFGSYIMENVLFKISYPCCRGCTHHPQPAQGCWKVLK